MQKNKGYLILLGCILFMFHTQNAQAASIPNPTFTPTVTPRGGVLELAGDLVDNGEVIAYPMPASSNVSFAFKSENNRGEVIIKVYNSNFRLVKTLTATTTTGKGILNCDVSNIAPGIYFYQVSIEGERLPMQRMVIAR